MAGGVSVHGLGMAGGVGLLSTAITSASLIPAISQETAPLEDEKLKIPEPPLCTKFWKGLVTYDIT